MTGRAFLAVMYPEQHEGSVDVALDEVEHLGALGHRCKVHREVEASAFGHRHPRVELDSLDSMERIARAVLVHEVASVDETEVLALWILHREVNRRCRVGQNHFAGLQLATVDVRRHCLRRLDGLVNFRLSRHCYNGKQKGNDGSLLHVHLVFKAFSISSLIVSTPGKPISV